jgi:hypothetical protein
VHPPRLGFDFATSIDLRRVEGKSPLQHVAEEKTSCGVKVNLPGSHRADVKVPTPFRKNRERRMGHPQKRCQRTVGVPHPSFKVAPLRRFRRRLPASRARASSLRREKRRWRNRRRNLPASPAPAFPCRIFLVRWDAARSQFALRVPSGQRFLPCRSC